MGPQFESVDIIAIVGDFIFKIDMAVALVKTGESYRQPAVARCNFPQTAERDEFRNVYFYRDFFPDLFSGDYKGTVMDSRLQSTPIGI